MGTMRLANSSIFFNGPLRLFIKPTNFSCYLAKMPYLNNKKAGNGFLSTITCSPLRVCPAGFEPAAYGFENRILKIRKWFDYNQLNLLHFFN
jgi:hypothetical protein